MNRLKGPSLAGFQCFHHFSIEVSHYQIGFLLRDSYSLYISYSDQNHIGDMAHIPIDPEQLLKIAGLASETLNEEVNQCLQEDKTCSGYEHLITRLNPNGTLQETCLRYPG